MGHNKLNLNMGGTAFNLNNGTASLAIMMSLTELDGAKDPDFQSLMPLSASAVERMAADMIKDGFDKSHPVHLWIRADGTKILIDGYTRLAAAKKAGLYEIAVYEHKDFADKRAAMIYALSQQIRRRNLSASELYPYVNRLNELSGDELLAMADQDGKTGGKKSAQIARMTGTSPRTVEMMTAIEKKGDDKLKEEVRTGKKAPSTAYNEMISAKAKKTKEPAQETGTGAPAPLDTFAHTDGAERPVISPAAELPQDVLKREKEKKFAEGFAGGFETALIYALAEVKKGRSPEDIWRDESVKDLSPAVIINFMLPPDDEDIVFSFGTGGTDGSGTEVL